MRFKKLRDLSKQEISQLRPKIKNAYERTVNLSTR